MATSLNDCIEAGTHLTACDDDGYCDFCGEQEQTAEGPYDDPALNRVHWANEVSRLETIFEAAGGRGVELADELDNARHQLERYEF